MNPTLKFVSWNVNGLRACVKKGFLDYFMEVDADFFCLQETKLQAGQIELELGDHYEQYWNYAEKKGYSGTAIFTKHTPLSVWYGLEDDSESEGRIITLEYETYYLVNVYTPNARRDLSRLDLRLQWEERFLHYVTQLQDKKPVIICGDLNVAHQEIDIKNAKSNIGNSGFTYEERACMTRLQNSGFIDTFRYLYPDTSDVYTWWSYMNKVRERNIGWRIDYFLTSTALASDILDSKVDTLIMGSDHCPIILELMNEKAAHH